MKKHRLLYSSTLVAILMSAAIAGIAAESPLRGDDYVKPLEYRNKHLGPGAEYHYYLLKSAFGAPQSISIVILDWAKDWRAGLHFCGEKRRPTSVQAKKINAEVAVNGTYFAFSNPPRAVLQLRIDGKTLFPAGKRIGAGFFYFNPGEFPKISAECPPEDQYQNILQSYPLLVADGNVLQSERSRVSHLGTHLAPLAVSRTIGKLDEVECIVDVGLQPFGRTFGM